MIDLLGPGPWVSEAGLSNGDMGVHLAKTAVVPIVECVVYQESCILRCSRRGSDNVHNSRSLGIGSGDGVDCGEFANSEGGDDGANAFDTRISISGVPSVQLIGVSHPMQSRGLDIV